MHLQSLAVAVAIGLASIACTAPSQATTLPADQAVRFLRLADVPGAFTASGRDPQRWQTPESLRGLTYAEAAALPEPVIAWVPNHALATAQARSIVSEAVRHGLGVLVTSVPGEERLVAKTFGVGGMGDTTLIHRGQDGVLDVLALADFAPDVTDAARLWPTTTRQKRSLRALSDDAPASVTSIPDEVPHVRYRVHPEGERGSSVSHEVTVIRDVTTTRDEKVVIVKARVDATPAKNGVSSRGGGGFERDGRGDFLTIPDSYTVRTIVGWESKDVNPGVYLERVIPDDSPDVNRTVERSSGVSTSYGAGSSATAEDTLKGLGISAIGKVPLEFSVNRTYTDATNVSMVTQSYYTAQTEEDLGKARGVVWSFHLANDIAGDPTYFRTPNGATVDTSKMTPMMRKASTELLSVWRVPGSFEGRLWIGSGASVENRRYSHNNSYHLGLDPSSDTTPDNGPPHWWFWTRGEDPFAAQRLVPAQPAQVFPVDLDSPYLTSSPTVLIQSHGGVGDCLAQADFTGEGGGVVLGACDPAESNLAQQWNMDKEGRYRNRASGQCLDAGEGNVAVTAPCALRLTQRWHWAADRVVSKTDGGTMQRLENRGGKVFVAFDPSRHDPIVLNTDNALLPPWSNYPLKPTEGSTIPRLNAEAPDVPDSYHAYRDVPAGERWLTIALRRSIQ